LGFFCANSSFIFLKKFKTKLTAAFFSRFLLTSEKTKRWSCQKQSKSFLFSAKKKHRDRYQQKRKSFLILAKKKNHRDIRKKFKAFCFQQKERAKKKTTIIQFG
jgi:hypothetical protein